jgi:hypothetical protein
MLASGLEHHIHGRLDARPKFEGQGALVDEHWQPAKGLEAG